MKMTDKYKCDLCDEDDLEYHEVRSIHKNGLHICNDCISDLSDIIFEDMEYNIEQIVEDRIQKRFSEYKWNKKINKKLGLNES